MPTPNKRFWVHIKEDDSSYPVGQILFMTDALDENWVDLTDIINSFKSEPLSVELLNKAATVALRNQSRITEKKCKCQGCFCQR